MEQQASDLRDWLRWAGRAWQELLAYGLIPLLTGYCVISRAFQGDGMLPIDSGDEPAETFIQVPLAQAEMAAGEFPQMNLFNNFGTPILGEPVVYPFALHAWTYAVFRPVVAMLVNKFVLAALSMVVLTVFFARYFQPLIGSFCAFLAFSSPAFFYFFQNHPHQGALFYFGLLLVAWRWFLDRPTACRGCWLYAVFLFFYLSVGVNGALLGTMFLLGYAALMPGRDWKALGWGLGLWGAALVAVCPHFVEFFRLAAVSARKELDYQSLTAIPRLAFIKGLFFGGSQAAQASVSYGLGIIALIAGGLAWAVFEWRRAARNSPAEAAARVRHFRELCTLSFILGVAPGLGVVLCRLFPGMAASVPLLKAMNVSRVLWFSDIFLMLAAGVAANAVMQAARPYNVTYRVVWGILLTVCLGMRYSAFRTQANFYCIPESYTQFQPAEFLQDIRPNTRLATLSDPFPLSQDTKINQNGVLGSGGRSIILDKAFRDYLLGRKLIELGCNGMTYYFRPAPPEVLGRFGIRYCLAPGRGEQLAEWGWKPLVVLDDAGSSLCALYENPAEVTPLYVAGQKPEFLQRYRLVGNSIDAQLPPQRAAYDVVATFLVRPGWKAFINGKPVRVQASEEHFIRVRVEPSQSWQQLRLKYAPWSNVGLLGCAVCSLAGAGLVCWVLNLPRRRANVR